MADDEWVLLTYTPRTSSSKKKRSEDGVKEGLPTEELRDANPVLPVRLQLGLGQTADIRKEHKDQILERSILEIERTIFNAEVLTDPERCRQMQEVFLPHAAVLMKLLSGSVIRLMFLRQTDVDRFYHNHYRVGEGSLSQQLSHILISEHLQDKVKGAQLIVRLQVKHEDYVWVRDRLGRGLDRTTSVDNLLALPPPNRQVERSSLRGLDLAVVGRHDRSCTDGADDVSTLNFTVRQVQAAVRPVREKSEGQARQLQELQIKQGLMQAAREDTEATVRSLSKEVFRLTDQKEKAETNLRRCMLEIRQLHETETNKRISAVILEAAGAKHTAVRKAGKNSHQMEVQLQTMRGQLDIARQNEDVMRKEVERMIQKEEMIQKVLSEHKEEIQRLQDINRTKELKIETMQEDIKAVREQTEATVFHSVAKETANLKKENEEAQRSLQKQQEEIQQLQETNKNMVATTDELTAENTKMSNQLTEIPELREEIRKWREKDKTSQEVLSEQKLEIQQLQETNKKMAATIKELLYEKDTAKSLSQGQGYVEEEDPAEEKDSTSGKSIRLSEPEDKPKASNKATKARRSVLLVSDEYGTSKGGISTINLNVAHILTATGATVYTTVLVASQQDERDAERDGVRLLKPRLDPDSSVKPSLEWLTAYHSVHFPHIPSDVSCIVGHVDVTSRAARKIKEERFPHAKLAMFGHVAPEETEHYKSDEKALGVGRKEASIQDDIGKADVVFSVGPRIHRHYDRFLRRNHVDHHIFLPEPSKVFSEANVIFENEDEVERPERVVLSIGRVRNVEMLKGHDLAAGAIDKAAQRLHNQYTLRLRVRGIDENDFKDSKKILEEKLRSSRVKPTLLPYGSQEEIRRDMEACHLVLMPSRAEPFGLVGLEAIAAGVPVLISKHSGLAELVEQLAKKYQPLYKFRHCIVTMKGDTATDADVEKWAERIEDVLKNARSEFAEARAFREKLLASKYWEESHQKFLQACGITATPSA